MSANLNVNDVSANVPTGAKAATSLNVNLIALVAGLIFGTGLILSGMTDPANIIAFLDVTGGNWDPRLMFVMGGAVLVAIPAFAYARRHTFTPMGQRFQLPPGRTLITPRLVIGAIIFGIGWGLSGLCPGPSLVLASTGNIGGLIFVGAMAAGMLVSRKLSPR